MMRKNKLFYSLLCGGFILASAITSFAASSSASLALQVHETKVESAAVGLATKANADVWNSAKSTGNVTVKIYAVSQFGRPYGGGLLRFRFRFGNGRPGNIVFLLGKFVFLLKNSGFFQLYVNVCVCVFGHI